MCAEASDEIFLDVRVVIGFIFFLDVFFSCMLIFVTCNNMYCDIYFLKPATHYGDSAGVIRLGDIPPEIITRDLAKNLYFPTDSAERHFAAEYQDWQ